MRLTNSNFLFDMFLLSYSSFYKFAVSLRKLSDSIDYVSYIYLHSSFKNYIFLEFSYNLTIDSSVILLTFVMIILE